MPLTNETNDLNVKLARILDKSESLDTIDHNLNYLGFKYPEVSEKLDNGDFKSVDDIRDWIAKEMQSLKKEAGELAAQISSDNEGETESFVQLDF